MKQPIAIIIARGGSKRLPRKNVLPFCGLPLAEWSVIQACCSRHIGAENTYLSTDDDEIAEIGQRHDIHVLRRPDWPDADARSGAVEFGWAIEQIEREREFDTLLTILPTNPVRHPDDLDINLEEYIRLKNKYPDVRTVTTSAPHEETTLYKYIGEDRMIWWAIGKAGYFGGQGIIADVHDLSGWKKHYGNSTYQTMGTLSDSAAFLDPEVEGFIQYYRPVFWYQSFDIDNLDTFELCEILMERYILVGRGPEIYYTWAGGAML